jgi:hypothetical protein
VGRKANLVKIIASLWIFASFCASAQPQPDRSNGRQLGPPPRPLPSMQGMRERWLSLPPAARQDLRRNAERWMRMSPEERNIMRQRENLRREQIRRETEAALRDSGLLLDPQSRNLFESRYVQERRKMEQALRHQIEVERQQQLPALIQQLKKEFQLRQPLNGSPAPRATQPPKSGR